MSSAGRVVVHNIRVRVLLALCLCLGMPMKLKLHLQIQVRLRYDLPDFQRSPKSGSFGAPTKLPRLKYYVTVLKPRLRPLESSNMLRSIDSADNPEA